MLHFFYWNGPEVPENILEFNDAPCGQVNIPEKRFQQEGNDGEICTQAHVEYIKEATEVKSITLRRCVKPDKVINEKCIALKTLKDLNSLMETSKFKLYDRDDVVKYGVACGCKGNLCNSVSHLIISKFMTVIILLHFSWVL